MTLRKNTYITTESITNSLEVQKKLIVEFYFEDVNVDMRLYINSFRNQFRQLLHLIQGLHPNINCQENKSCLSLTQKREIKVTLFFFRKFAKFKCHEICLLRGINMSRKFKVPNSFVRYQTALLPKTFGEGNYMQM